MHFLRTNLAFFMLQWNFPLLHTKLERTNIKVEFFPSLNNIAAYVADGLHCRCIMLQSSCSWGHFSVFSQLLPLPLPLHNSTQGKSAKDKVVTRIMVSRCEVDLMKIRSEFKRQHGKSLYQTIAVSSILVMSREHWSIELSISQLVRLVSSLSPLVV